MATAPATPITSKKFTMREVKAAEQIQFTKQGQEVRGILLSIDPTTVKEKEAIEYLILGERGDRATFLGTADLNKKIHPGHVGHMLAIKYETDDSSFQKAGQSPMKIFKVQVSEEKAEGF